MSIVLNQREYAWGDIIIFLFGQPVAGVRGIEYKKKKEKNFLHAAGRDPRAIQHGKRENEGSITLLQSELAALERSAKAKGYRDILDVDFDIIVTYSSAGIVTVDRIMLASLSEAPKTMKEGDQNMEITLPFIALRIQEEI